MLFLYSWACRRRDGPLTSTAIFATLGWWRAARTDLKILWSHSAGTRASGCASRFPWPYAPSIVILQTPAPLSSRLILSIPRPPDYWEFPQGWDRKQVGGKGCLVCSVTSCWHGLRRSDTELSLPVWKQAGPESLTFMTLFQTSGIDRTAFFSLFDDGWVGGL